MQECSTYCAADRILAGEKLPRTRGEAHDHREVGGELCPINRTKYIIIYLIYHPCYTFEKWLNRTPNPERLLNHIIKKP